MFEAQIRNRSPGLVLGGLDPLAVLGAQRHRRRLYEVGIAPGSSLIGCTLGTIWSVFHGTVGSKSLDSRCFFFKFVQWFFAPNLRNDGKANFLSSSTRPVQCWSVYLSKFQFVAFVASSHGRAHLRMPLRPHVLLLADHNLITWQAPVQADGLYVAVLVEVLWFPLTFRWLKVRHTCESQGMWP